MTLDDRKEYARLVKSLDLAMRQIQPAYWPLVLPAVELMRHVEQSRYPCTMCHQMRGHTCSCPVRGVQRGLRRRAACR